MGTRDMLQVAGEMVKGTSLPVAVQPNAGVPELCGEETFFPETAEQMAEVAGEFKAAGVKILGGCCGTTPEYIASVKSRLGL
jgi:5-methyltetrahydrofolate--homocysteine methyltransferase